MKPGHFSENSRRSRRVTRGPRRRFRAFLSRLMVGAHLMIGAAVLSGLAAPASAQNVDLRIRNLSIDPVPAGVQGPALQLHMYRSYRVRVEIDLGGPGRIPPSQSFTVRTECLRGGARFFLGEGRIAVAPRAGGRLYAVYDVFPSGAGAGNCMLRTTIDVDGEVFETDESLLSNAWDRAAVVLP